MLPMQEQITGITHPNVTAIYLKHDYSQKGRAQDVLVIETSFDPSKNQNDQVNSAYMELLKDLRNLQRRAEKKIGHVDRIEIRQAH